MRLNEQASEDLAHELHAANYSGGSSAGMHYWSDAAKCGMRAVLNTKARVARQNDPHGSIPPLEHESKDRKQAFAVGSAYHKLHELVRTKGSILSEMRDGEMLTVKYDHMSASMVEAIRLFNGYMAHWPINLWGDPVAIEREFVCEMLGHKVTAMPDLVTHLSAEQLPAAKKRCPQLTEPGYYVIDFKTSDMPYDDLYYKSSLQALWYPYAWNEIEQERPVRGMIFDAIYKFGRRKDKAVTAENFGSTFVATDFTNAQPIAGMLEQASGNIERAKERGIGNRAECYQFSFQGTHTCKYYGNGCTNEFA